MRKPYDHVRPHINPIPEAEAKRPSLRAIFESQGLHKLKTSHPRGSKGPYHFFCWLLEREKPNEKAVQVTIADKTKGDVKAWVWPYATRLIVNAIKFLNLGREDQKYIVAAREERVFWRGDEIDFFRSIFDETMRWRSLDGQGKAEHVQSAKARFSKNL